MLPVRFGDLSDRICVQGVALMSYSGVGYAVLGVAGEQSVESTPMRKWGLGDTFVYRREAFSTSAGKEEQLGCSVFLWGSKSV